MYRKPAPLPPSSAPDQWMLDWFAKRGITPEVVAANRISAGMAFSPIEGKPVRAIHFPYFRDGEHINTKHRGPGKTFWMERGAERILYGLDKIGESKAAVLVEGEMDALSIEVAGGPPALSVPDGAPAPDAKNYAAKFAFLESAEAKLADLRQILIATDMDAPGRKLAEELARRLGPERCLRVDWPEGCKDANDTLVRHGVEGARAALDAARPYPRSAALADPTLGVTNSARRQIHVVPPVRGRRVIIDLPHHEVSDAR